MEVNHLKSENNQKKPPFILVLIPILNSLVISPIIKYFDKENYSDWAVILTWSLTGISIICLGIFIKKMIELGRLSKQYVLIFSILFMVMLIVSSYLMYQTHKPF